MAEADAPPPDARSPGDPPPAATAAAEPPSPTHADRSDAAPPNATAAPTPPSSPAAAAADSPPPNAGTQSDPPPQAPAEGSIEARVHAGAVAAPHASPPNARSFDDPPRHTAADGVPLSITPEARAAGPPPSRRSYRDAGNPFSALDGDDDDDDTSDDDDDTSDDDGDNDDDSDDVDSDDDDDHDDTATHAHADATKRVEPPLSHLLSLAILASRADTLDTLLDAEDAPLPCAAEDAAFQAALLARHTPAEPPPPDAPTISIDSLCATLATTAPPHPSGEQLQAVLAAGDVVVPTVVDTGAGKSAISTDLFFALPAACRDDIVPHDTALGGAERGSRLAVRGASTIRLRQGDGKPFSVYAIVIDNLAAHCPFLLGMPALNSGRGLRITPLGEFDGCDRSGAPTRIRRYEVHVADSPILAASALAQPSPETDVDRSLALFSASGDIASAVAAVAQETPGPTRRWHSPPRDRADAAMESIEADALGAAATDELFAIAVQHPGRARDDAAAKLQSWLRRRRSRQAPLLQCLLRATERVDALPGRSRTVVSVDLDAAPGIRVHVLPATTRGGALVPGQMCRTDEDGSVQVIVSNPHRDDRAIWAGETISVIRRVHSDAPGIHVKLAAALHSAGAPTEFLRTIAERKHDLLDALAAMLPDLDVSGLTADDPDHLAPCRKMDDRGGPLLAALAPPPAPRLKAPAAASSPLSPDGLNKQELGEALGIPSNPWLDASQKQELLDLVWEFRDRFSENELYGCFGPDEETKVEHDIDIGDARPVRRRPYRMSPAEREIVRRRVAELEEKGLIRKSKSPWNAPVVLVPKRDQQGGVKAGWRFCIDYTGLNKLTRYQSFALPYIDSIIDDMAQAAHGDEPAFWSICDALSGYYQCRMSERSIPLTAFVTPDECYEWLVLPMGLKSAASTFQRMMSNALRPLRTGGGCLRGMDETTLPLVPRGVDGADHPDDIARVARHRGNGRPQSSRAYIDDITTGSRGWHGPHGHLRHLRELFMCLRAARITLKTRKAHFARGDVESLGTRLTRDGRLPRTEHTDTISSWPRPGTRRAMLRFLGLAVYCRGHVVPIEFRDAFAPLLRLVADMRRQRRQRITDDDWTADIAAAFERAKELFRSPHVLRHIDLSADAGTFIVESDASTSGKGIILKQIQRDGTEGIVGFWSASHKTDAQRRAAAHELEADALVWGITKKLHHYLAGRHFICRTDASSLKWLLQGDLKRGKHGRWQAALLEYDFTVEYRAGRLNGGPDALSRIHMDAVAASAPAGFDQAQALAGARIVSAVRNSPRFLRIREAGPDPPIAELATTEDSRHWIRHVHLDGIAGPLRDALVGNQPDFAWLPDVAWRPAVDAKDPRKRSAARGEYTLRGGLLHRIAHDFNAAQTRFLRLYVPDSLRASVIDTAHSRGHLGVHKITAQLKREFYWPGMDRDIRAHVGRCTLCQRAKATLHHDRSPLQPLATNRPMDTVGIDLVSGFGAAGSPQPLSTVPGTQARHILSVTDWFSRFCWLIPIPDKSARTVARALHDRVFATFGVPRAVVSDNGTEFAGVSREMFKLFKIKRRVTTPYHPAANGATERVHRVLKAYLRVRHAAGSVNWAQDLPALEFALRVAPITHLNGLAPFRIMFGREPHPAIDDFAQVDPRAPDLGLEAASAWTKTLHRSLIEAHEFVRNFDREHKEQAKARWDKALKRRVTYKPGDLVLLHAPPARSVITAGTTTKLSLEWFGPYKVVSRHHDSYKIADTRTLKERRAHVKHLQPYRAPEPELADQASAWAPPGGEAAGAPGAADAIEPPPGRAVSNADFVLVLPPDAPLDKWSVGRVVATPPPDAAVDAAPSVTLHLFDFRHSGGDPRSRRYFPLWINSRAPAQLADGSRNPAHIKLAAQVPADSADPPTEWQPLQYTVPRAHIVSAPFDLDDGKIPSDAWDTALASGRVAAPRPLNAEEQVRRFSDSHDLGLSQRAAARAYGLC